MITRKKEKESLKKSNFYPSSDIESSPISNSHNKKVKKAVRKKKEPEPKFHLSDQMKKHNLLEILEFRIHFDQDPTHGHPAQSVSILDELPDQKIDHISEEERSMKSHYQVINPIQIIPDFWPKRVYDDVPEFNSPQKNKKNSPDQLQHDDSNGEDNNNDNSKYYDNRPNIIPVVKLSSEESQILLKKIIAASDVKLRNKQKQKKSHAKNNRHNQRASYDKDGEFSNPEGDEDDEFDKNEMKKLISLDVYGNRRSRSSFRGQKNRKEFSKFVLSLPSLLYDTDESCDETDIELF